MCVHLFMCVHVCACVLGRGVSSSLSDRGLVPRRPLAELGLGLALRRQQKSVFPTGNLIPVNRCLGPVDSSEGQGGAPCRGAPLRSVQEAEQWPEPAL